MSEEIKIDVQNQLADSVRADIVPSGVVAVTSKIGPQNIQYNTINAESFSDSGIKWSIKHIAPNVGIGKQIVLAVPLQTTLEWTGLGSNPGGSAGIKDNVLKDRIGYACTGLFNCVSALDISVNGQTLVSHNPELKLFAYSADLTNPDIDLSMDNMLLDGEPTLDGYLNAAAVLNNPLSSVSLDCTRTTRGESFWSSVTSTVDSYTVSTCKIVINHVLHCTIPVELFSRIQSLHDKYLYNVREMSIEVRFKQQLYRLLSFIQSSTNVNPAGASLTYTGFTANTSVVATPAIHYSSVQLSNEQYQSLTLGKPALGPCVYTFNRLDHQWASMGECKNGVIPTPRSLSWTSNAIPNKLMIWVRRNYNTNFGLAAPTATQLTNARISESTGVACFSSMSITCGNVTVNLGNSTYALWALSKKNGLKLSYPVAVKVGFPVYLKPEDVAITSSVMSNSVINFQIQATFANYQGETSDLELVATMSNAHVATLVDGSCRVSSAISLGAQEQEQLRNDAVASYLENEKGASLRVAGGSMQLAGARPLVISVDADGSMYDARGSGFFSDLWSGIKKFAPRIIGAIPQISNAVGAVGDVVKSVTGGKAGRIGKLY